MVAKKKVLDRKISRSIDFERSLWCSSSVVQYFSLFRSQCVKQTLEFLKELKILKE